MAVVRLSDTYRDVTLLVLKQIGVFHKKYFFSTKYAYEVQCPDTSKYNNDGVPKKRALLSRQNTRQPRRHVKTLLLQDVDTHIHSNTNNDRSNYKNVNKNNTDISCVDLSVPQPSIFDEDDGSVPERMSDLQKKTKKTVLWERHNLRKPKDWTLPDQKQAEILPLNSNSNKKVKKRLCVASDHLAPSKFIQEFKTEGVILSENNIQNNEEGEVMVSEDVNHTDREVHTHTHTCIGGTRNEQIGMVCRKRNKNIYKNNNKNIHKQT